MSVNLKGRKSAKSEQVEELAPQELVMAGAQTPWATEAPTGSPFAEQGMPPGMPTLPPPPPPYAPGEAPQEAEADAEGRKSPLSKPMILALAAVIVVGGGGYYFLNSGSSSSSTPAPVVHVLTPAQRLAQAKARAAAAAVAAKPTAAGAAAAKPTSGAAKAATTPAKAATTPAKGAVKAAAPAAGTTKTSTTSSKTPVYTAALPGAINGWDKLIVKKAPDTLATFDTVLGASITNIQYGAFGGTTTEPLLTVAVADHSKNPTGKAMDLLREGLKEDRADGVVVSPPFFVPHTPWGGTAACATEAGDDASGDDLSAVTCVWVDNNTVGSIFAPHRIASQALPLLNSVRSQVEK